MARRARTNNGSRKIVNVMEELLWTGIDFYTFPLYRVATEMEYEYVIYTLHTRGPQTDDDVNGLMSVNGDTDESLQRSFRHQRETNFWIGDKLCSVVLLLSM